MGEGEDVPIEVIDESAAAAASYISETKLGSYI